MEVGKSLSDWKAESLDLERPRSYENEEKELQRVAHELLVEDGTCSGHAGFRRLGSCIELHTVVIAPAFRGTGRSHTLLQASISRWRQDRILNGASVQPKVDLAAAVRGEEAVEKPRFHHQWLPDAIQIEKLGFSPETISSLESRGHMIKYRTTLGEANCIEVRDGLIYGSADSRRNSSAIGY